MPSAFAGRSAFIYRVDKLMRSLSNFSELNLNGWSLLAIRTSFETMSEACRILENAIGFESPAPVQVIVRPDGEPPRDLDGNYLEGAVRPDQRDVVLLHPKHSEWCIALRSLNFVDGDDINWVTDVAQRQSAMLQTTTVACFGEDICDCFVFEKGKRLKALRGQAIDEASRLFDDYGISVPACITAGNPTRVAATAQTCNELANVALVRFSIERPPAVEPSRVAWRKDYFTIAVFSWV
jgi:hypothetical protein